MRALPCSLYHTNAPHQAIPDVAAQADLFRVFLSGRPVSIGGTSAAAPTFTGIVSLLNAARLEKGLPPLGFLNPLVYAIQALDPTAFNDITVGNNPGCGTPGFNVSALPTLLRDEEQRLTGRGGTGDEGLGPHHGCRHAQLWEAEGYCDARLLAHPGPVRMECMHLRRECSCCRKEIYH